MPEQWPEGRFADPAAARERYDAGLRGARGAAREVLRAEPPDAHLGLGVVAVAVAVTALLAGPVPGSAVAGVFAALFLATLAVMRLRGVRGMDAVRRSYLFTFGWGQWI
ncbi:hypothetical protein [Streptomyces sp. CO7]